jgi:hypothetical protein
MATVDSQVLQAMSAISSWAECSNANDRAINQLATPLKWDHKRACVLDVAIFS